MSKTLDNIFLSISVNSEIFLLLAFVKYMLYSGFTQSCIYLYFLEAKNPCFVKKIIKNLLILVYLFCPKKSTSDFTKTFITNSGIFGRRKLSDPSLNRIFKTLSIGAQYALSFQ